MSFSSPSSTRRSRPLPGRGSPGARRSIRREFRLVVFEGFADLHQLRGLAVPDGDHEAFIDEEQDLAQLDDLDRIDVAGGLEHDEEGVVVDVELGPLVGVDGVLDRQLVEIELLGTASNSSSVGSYSPIQAKCSPGDTAPGSSPARKAPAGAFRCCRGRRRQSRLQATGFGSRYDPSERHDSQG